jgi:death-on-curing protein
VDGKKRTALVVARVFLLEERFGLKANEAERVRIMLALAAGEIEESDMARWFRDNLRPGD